jgi:anthranilate phosphoribosyltransferase
MGVYAADLTAPLAQALGNLGATHAFVVHGMDGLDEITITGKTRVSEFKEGKVKDSVIHPADFALPLGKVGDLRGGDAKENAAITIDILKGQIGPRRDIVLLNAAAGFVASGKAEDFKEGIRLAADSIDSGAALRKVEQLKAFTNRS